LSEALFRKGSNDIKDFRRELHSEGIEVKRKSINFKKGLPHI
jgi:hypothetical protein